MKSFSPNPKKLIIFKERILKSLKKQTKKPAQNSLL